MKLSIEELFIKKIIFNHKGSDGVALDFGAHRGMYTEVLSDKFSEYYGFEPFESNYTHLYNHYQNQNVFFIQKVIGTNTTSEKYYLNDNSAFNSILCNKDNQENFINCPSETIDNFCKGKKISFLKCDVQGAEKIIFEYGVDTLKNNIIDICLEVHQGVNHKNLYSFFNSLGYKVYDKEFTHINIDEIPDDRNHFDAVFITNSNKELYEIIDFGSKMISCESHQIINHYHYKRPREAVFFKSVIKKNDFLREEEVNQIVEEIKTRSGNKFEKSILVHDTGKSRVSNKAFSFNPSILTLKDKILDELMWLNNDYFRFNITHAAFRYIEYDTEDFFLWHPDSSIGFENGLNYYVTKEYLQRKLTAIISLTNNDEYVGGNFSVVDPGYEPENVEKTFKLNKGNLILFPPFYSHKVDKITAGTRKSLVVWLSGTRLR